ncbi:hypothetical protein PV327_007080 [Microctonus hyperodae]|uniref:MD-2-related lipid-recognition domain-containing protein n=1 Tax=Microctonus hyperodae TaxID=165561 RepID=A0AA39F5L9_MICHY|nr:hypothetical protein PV327_007080 [Microctonus hyperodae]
MFKIISLFVLCLCAFSSAEYSDCGSEVGSFTQVTVSNCSPDAGKCILRRGTSTTITIDFTIKKPVQTITSAVFGEILGNKIPFPISNPNACTDPNSGISCPLSGNTFRYTNTLPIDRLYPRVSVNVLWKLQDENQKNIVCVEIPAKIQ